MRDQAVALHVAKALLDHQQHVPEGNAVLDLLQPLYRRLVRLPLAGQSVLLAQLEVLEAILIGELGVEEGDVLVEGEALLLDVPLVYFFEGAGLIEAEDFLDLVEGDFLCGFRGD